MRYQEIRTEGTKTVYHVLDQGRAAAEFSFHTEEGERAFENFFWLDDVRIADTHLNYGCMDAILQFVRYKCWRAGFGEIWLRVSGKNLLYIEWYQRYGFSVIAQESMEVKPGAYHDQYVMKYRLPRTRDELFHHYIRRKDGEEPLWER